MRIIAFLFIVIVLSSCNYMGGKRVRGDGNAASQIRPEKDFRSVEVSGPIKVFLRQGPAYSVEVRADRNLMEYIETSKEGNELRIRPRRRYNLSPRTSIEVFITAPEYEQLSVTGSGKIQSQSLLSSNRIKASVAGSGDVLLEVDAPDVRSSITGSGNIVIKGRAQHQEAKITGSGELHAFDLLTESSKVEITGSGDAELFASKRLDIHIAGSGNVDYKGDPTISKSIAGSGNINRAN